jgi:hypothetical protein
MAHLRPFRFAAGCSEHRTESSHAVMNEGAANLPGLRTET